MTPFRFRLEKVLTWRRMQLELEEIKFRQVSAAVVELDRARAALENEARRHCRLLERLKERRLEEWEAAFARELEDLAADSHLAALAPRHV